MLFHFLVFANPYKGYRQSSIKGMAESFSVTRYTLSTPKNAVSYEKVHPAGPAVFRKERQHPGQADGNGREDRICVADGENVEDKHQKEQHADDKARRDAQRGHEFHVEDADLHAAADKEAVHDVQDRIDEQIQPEQLFQRFCQSVCPYHVFLPLNTGL